MVEMPQCFSVLSVSTPFCNTRVKLQVRFLIFESASALSFAALAAAMGLIECKRCASMGGIYNITAEKKDSLELLEVI